MIFPFQLQKFILQNQSVQLFVPDPAKIKEAYKSGEIPFPYWSQVWPSAIALSDFLLLHTQLIRNKRVVELGAGLGLPSIVAAHYAVSVLCTDHIEQAVTLAKQSAIHNQLDNFQTAVVDWKIFPESIEADVLLLSDINYDPAAFGLLRKIIIRFIQNGGTVILSTPQRLMAKEFILPLLQHCRQEEEITVDNKGQPAMITVLILR